MRVIKTVQPIKCNLLTDKYLGQSDLSPLIRIREYINDGHIIRALMQCSQCCQKYCYELNEEMDWEDGNDPLYRTYIPIEHNEDTIAALNKMSSLDLSGPSPRLKDNWEKNESTRPDQIVWVGFDPKTQIPRLTERAFRLAYQWHKDQIRKGDNSPYIFHPVAVADLLAQNGFSEETIAAGYCHDLLEDTPCSEGEILAECGMNVLEIVKTVTNKNIDDWERKKLDYIDSVRAGPVEAKAVCVVDKICNLHSLIKAYRQQGPGLWKKFNRGKDKKLWFEQNVLKMLMETWNHPLIGEYGKLITVLESLESN